MEIKRIAKLNKVTGANSHPASQFESRGLRRRALVVEGHGRYRGESAVRSVLALYIKHWTKGYEVSSVPLRQNRQTIHALLKPPGNVFHQQK